MHTVTGVIPASLLAQQSGAIESLSNPDNAFVVLFLGVLLILLAVLLWMDKKVKTGNEVED